MTVCAEVMGAGVLSRHATATLGWVLGLACAVGFGAVSLYSGLLLARVACDLAPGAESFADAAAATVGPALRGVHARRDPAHVGAPAAVLPDGVRTRSATSPCRRRRRRRSATGSGWAPRRSRSSCRSSSFAPCAVVRGGGVDARDRRRARPRRRRPPRRRRAADAARRQRERRRRRCALAAVGRRRRRRRRGGRRTARFGSVRRRRRSSSVPGALIYLEIIREMRDRSHFRRTLYLATAAMVLVYVGVVAVGYATLGRAAPLSGGDAAGHADGGGASSPSTPSRTWSPRSPSTARTASSRRRPPTRRRPPPPPAGSRSPRSSPPASSSRRRSPSSRRSSRSSARSPARRSSAAIPPSSTCAARRGARPRRARRPRRVRRLLAVCLPLFTVLGTADAVREIASGWGEDPAGPFACAANRTASFGGLPTALSVSGVSSGYFYPFVRLTCAYHEHEHLAPPSFPRPSPPPTPPPPPHSPPLDPRGRLRRRRQPTMSTLRVILRW